MSSTSGNTLYQQAVQAYQQQRLKTAEHLCQQVLQHQPRHTEALHLLAILCAQSQRLSEAKGYAQKAVKADRRCAECHNTLGNILQRQGDWEAAKRSYQQAARLSPKLAEAQHNLGAMFRRLGEAALAEACFLKAVKLKPDYGDALQALGVLYEEQGQLDKAIAYYEKLLKMQPSLAAAHHALGLLQRRQNNKEEALACFERAIAVQPDDVESYMQAGELCQLLARKEQAVQFFQAAIKVKPNNVELLFRVSQFCKDHSYWNTAVEFYYQILQLEPSYAKAWLELGEIYFYSGRLAKSQQAFECCLAKLDSNSEPEWEFQAYNGLASVKNAQGFTEAALADFEKTLALAPNRHGLHANLMLFMHYSAQYRRADFFARSQQFQQHCLAAGFTPLEHKTHDFHQPLKIAYISEDFRAHSVGYFMENILRLHDHSRFEVFIYMRTFVEDAVSERLKSYVQHWQNCTHMSPVELIQHIQEDEIDLLIDLAGHTGINNNTLVLARKPAPVQMTYLGYPDTTGLDAVDYRIADIYTEPEDAQIYSSETILRMPHSYFCYQPDAEAAELPVGDAPALRNGFITLGSFNNYSKINDFTVALWAAALQAVPTARLFLKAKSFNDPDTRRACLARFVAQGIDAERIEIVAYAESLTAHLQLYQKIDFCLDTHPYHGATTTCEALWMGVSVLSLQGETHAGRIGQSLLTTVGLPEWAVETREEFIAKAQAFAADVAYLQTLRQGMRARLQASPLMQGEAFTRDLEALYEYAVAEVKAKLAAPQV